jgi:AraC-like DNA-binding protein
MQDILNHQFSLPQLLILLGVAQAVYALVYISLRVARTSLILVPASYYAILAGCFLYDFAASLSQESRDMLYPLGFGLWALIPSFSYLLIIQLTLLKTPPPPRHFLILLVPIFTAGIAFLVSYLSDVKDSMPERLAIGGQWLDIMSLVGGCLVLLLIWLQRKELDTIWADKSLGRPRYWVIICILLMNVALLACGTLHLSGVTGMEEVVLIRTILGLCFVYLAATSLFRIYPLALNVIKEKRLVASEDQMPEEDKRLIDHLQKLLNVDKVYQEQEYSRASFAAELGVSEATVSRLANDYLRKTIPQLLNEYRVEDAKVLLKETDAPIQIVAKEAGFPSLATFNRVFRDLSGKTPSEYRKETASHFVKLTG